MEWTTPLRADVENSSSRLQIQTRGPRCSGPSLQLCNTGGERRRASCTIGIMLRNLAWVALLFAISTSACWRDRHPDTVYVGHDHDHDRDHDRHDEDRH